MFYKVSKQRFDSDPEFKQRAQQAVVRLQVKCQFSALQLPIVIISFGMLECFILSCYYLLYFQGGEAKYHKAWEKICEISRTEFQRVYQRLGVHLEERVNEVVSFVFTVGRDIMKSLFGYRLDIPMKFFY